MGDLAIREVADLTGIAAGTIRMWEQRYGFPDPQRTASGYRRYSDDDVESLRRVASFRRLGLSIPAAIDRVRGAADVSERRSIYAAVAAVDTGARPQLLGKPTMLALSQAIEHESLAQTSAPVLFASFQHETAYRRVEHVYRRLAAQSEAATVFADFPTYSQEPGRPVEVPIDRDDAIGNEWAVIVDAPGYAACLLGWEQPSTVEPFGPDDAQRRFEAIWTVHPQAVRRAAEVAARLAGHANAEYGGMLSALLDDRPLATESPAPALTALTNRAIGYLDRA